MRNPKFKSPSTVALSLPSIKRRGSLRKRIKLVQRGQKVTLFAVIGGFQSILKVSFSHGPLIADVQISKLWLTPAKNATVGGDLSVRFRLLLKGAVIVRLIGHFRVAFYFCFTTSPSAKPFIRKWVWFASEWTCEESWFTHERFRTWTRFETVAKGTRKWPIGLALSTGNLTWVFKTTITVITISIQEKPP